MTEQGGRDEQLCLPLRLEIPLQLATAHAALPDGVALHEGRAAAAAAVAVRMSCARCRGEGRFGRRSWVRASSERKQNETVSFCSSGAPPAAVRAKEREAEGWVLPCRQHPMQAAHCAADQVSAACNSHSLCGAV